MPEEIWHCDHCDGRHEGERPCPEGKKDMGCINKQSWAAGLPAKGKVSDRGHDDA